MQIIRSREATVRLLRRQFPAHKIVFTATKTPRVDVPVPDDVTVRFFGKADPETIATYHMRQITMGWLDDNDGHRVWAGLDKLDDRLYVWCPQEGESD